MPQVHLLDDSTQPAGRSASGPEAQLALASFGIQTGRWAQPVQRVSTQPQLTFAREWGALQRRFGTVLTDRVQLRPGPRGALLWPEPAGEHVHDDCEVRVVLEGRALFVVRAPFSGRTIAVLAEAGDWVALPAGLPHALDTGREPRLDMLRLFSRRQGRAAQHRSGLRVDWLPRLDDLAPAPQALAA